VRPLALLSVLVVGGVAAAGCLDGIFPDNSRVGSAAKDLVDGTKYPRLVVELDYPPGHAPNAEAKSVLRSTLADVSGRDLSRVEIVEEAEIPAVPSKKYSLAEIVALEDEHRDHRTRGDTAVLYVLYVAGGYEADSGDSRVLGVAYRGTSVAIMKANIKDATTSTLLSPRPPEQCVERAVLVHEFGHAAGLVNLGTPMVRDHEDPQNRGHSSSRASVMYHAVENSRDLLSIFTGGCGDIPYRFDADDKADLQALRAS
jgi:hypothetical protein